MCGYPDKPHTMLRAAIPPGNTVAHVVRHAQQLSLVGLVITIITLSLGITIILQLLLSGISSCTVFYGRRFAAVDSGSLAAWSSSLQAGAVSHQLGVLSIRVRIRVRTTVRKKSFQISSESARAAPTVVLAFRCRLARSIKTTRQPGMTNDSQWLCQQLHISEPERRSSCESYLRPTYRSTQHGHKLAWRVPGNFARDARKANPSYENADVYNRVGSVRPVADMDGNS